MVAAPLARRIATTACRRAPAAGSAVAAVGRGQSRLARHFASCGRPVGVATRGGRCGAPVGAAGGTNRRPVRTFSSSPSYDAYDYDDAPDPSLSSNQSLKKVVRPFLRACHPDAMATNTEAASDAPKPHPLSHRAKAVNLEAVQTINGLVDAVEDLVGRCMPPAYSGSGSNKGVSAGSLPELKARYEIEFILPTGEVEEGPVKKKHRHRVPLSQRAVTVEFPEELRRDVRKWALTPFSDPAMHSEGEYEPSPSEEEAFHTAMQLRGHAASEFLRLLTIAGMQAPADADGSQTQQHPRRKGEQPKKPEQWTISDHFLHELGVHPTEEDPIESKRTTAFFGRTQSRPGKTAPPAYSHVQEQRQKFMDSIPWNLFADDYDNAFADAQADWMTNALNLYDPNTLEGRERRERFVSQICGSVRIWRASTDGAPEDVDEWDEIPEGLDVVAQLVAIRRLSLLLFDNFDYLQMEKMGRMWERLVIVLTPPRGLMREKRRQARLGEGEENARPTNRRRKKLNKWERRLRRREKLQPVSRGRMRHTAEMILQHKQEKEAENESPMKEANNNEETSPYSTESGFKFSYGTQADQGSGQVTAYIPIDFRDGELVRQLHTHVYDYFDTVSVGFLRYGADGKLTSVDK